MTILSPFTLKNGPNQFEAGQPNKSITAARVDTLIDSMAGVNAVSSPHSASYLPTDTSDAGTIIEMQSSSQITFTVPHSSSVAYDVHTVMQVHGSGTGTVVILAASGVTLLSPTGTSTLRAQYSTVGLRHRAQDIWVLSGELADVNATVGIGNFIIGTSSIG